MGYGHHQYMADGSNSQEMVLYLSAEQAANVTVSINGTTYSQNYSIPANSVNSPVFIPKTGTNDARLYNSGTSEGTFDRGVHIVSDVPITAFAHIYANTSSGATMLMPVETWGYNYYTLGATQNYASNCFAWFYIVASENNTKVRVTPSVPTRGGWSANQTYTISLNKGQIYQVLGANSGGSTGYDITGSTIKSVAGIDGTCHPIGVFSGSSRTMFCSNGASSNGGDNMLQQVFPASAWGTKYLTAPTSRSTGVTTYNVSIYRVAVRDPSTVVTRNGIPLPQSALINNFYYEFSSAVGEFIEADNPILVAQYMTSQPCSGNAGSSDPEMFYLSPIEQSIKKVVFYASSNYSITKGYISIIIPFSGVNTLIVDGSNTFDYVGIHPQNFGYRIVVKSISLNQQHIVESGSAFTATTYGMGDFESYGYNAGTLINNLNIIGSVQNTFGTTSTTTTCPNTPFKFSVRLAYRPDTMVWHLSQVGTYLVPHVDTTVYAPIAIDSTPVNGRKYYTYNLPREYIITDTGTFNIPITCTAPVIDNCNNTEDVVYTVRINPGPKADFNWVYSGCVSDTAYISGLPIANGYNIIKYRWFFDDNTQDSVINVKKKFNSQGGHPTKFRVIADNGCIGDSIKVITTTASPVATFGMNPIQSCGSATVTFTDTSSFAGSPLDVFYWNFGNGNILAANNNGSQTQFYPTWGTYIIKHYAGVTGGCRSDTAFKTLKIYANPLVNFGYTKGCLQDSTLQLSDSTIVPDGQTFTWSWNFGDPSSGSNNVSNLQHPTHKYTVYGTYNITLTVTTANGCTSFITKPYTVSGFASAIQYEVVNENNLCAQSLVKLNNQAIITQDSIYKIDIYWDFANSPTVFETDNTPTQGEQYTHQYLNFTTPLTKTYTIKWIVYSKGGCTSEKIKTITLHATPVVTFATLQGKCVNASVSSVASGSVTNGISGGAFTYSGPGTDATGNFNPALAGVGVQTIKYIYTSSFGCSDSTTQTMRVFPKPVSKFVYARDICVGDSIRFKDSATVSSGTIVNWNWNFGDATTANRIDSTAFFKPYATAATYTVKLVAISDSSCISDTFSLPVSVRQKPVSTITISSRLCKDTLVTVTPTSSFGSGTIQTWYYNFGNNQIVTTGNSNPVTTTYLTPGNYTIKHAVNAGSGCISDTATQTFTIYANPVADFTMSTGCLSDSTATFTDATSVSDGQSLNWSWNFGDPISGVNNTSIIQNPIHRYTQYNSYPVTLRATTVNGCSATKTKNFSVFGFVPTVLFAVSNELQLCSSKPVSLTHQTPITIDSIYKMEVYWDYLNNPTVFNTDNTPTLNEVYSHSYPVFFTPATISYTVKVKVYSKGGCTSEQTKVITVNAMPQITYNNMQGVCVNNGISSVATATINNGLTGVGKYYGVATDTLGNFNPLVAGAGLFTIKYVFTASGGCKDSASAQIRVFPKPVVGYKFSNNICLSDSILLTDTSKISIGTIKERHWDFSDATTAIKLNATPFYKKFTNFNTYTVKLNVISDSLCLSDTVSKNITVYPLPVVAFTPPSGVCMPLGEAKFTNQSTINGGDVNSLSYTWNFGDNTSSPIINPTHYFTASGPFNIQLIATSLQGCKDSLTIPLTAFFQQPIADFTIVADTLCPYKPILFSDNSTAPGSTISQWLWSFSNGDSSYLTSPTKYFPIDGLYTAKLVVKNPDGCTSNPISKSVTIYKQPVVHAGPVSIIYTPEGVSVPLMATINDTAAF